MKQLNFIVDRFGFVVLPVSLLSVGFNYLKGDYTKLYYDSTNGIMVSVKDPIIEFDGMKFTIRFMPKQEYRRSLYRDSDRIELYPDMNVKLDLTENNMIISYSTNINDIQIEGKFTLPNSRSENLTITCEHLPYAVKIEIE